MKRVFLSTALVLFLALMGPVEAWSFSPALAREEYMLLSRGAEGDGVTALQEQLKQLDYLEGKASGKFDEKTRQALIYLQFDLGLCQTGAADAALQERLAQGDVPASDPYTPLERGMYGARVTDLQNRLYELCYTNQAPTGYYDGETARAVERFQTQAGYPVDGDAIGKKQLQAIFDADAPQCQIYFHLRRQDASPAVRRLNKQLKSLGFISSSPGDSYTKKTVSGVEAYQKAMELTITGAADPLTQRLLFSGQTEPGQSSSSDKQAVDNSQIKTMRTWMNKNLKEKWDKEQAVTQFQMRLAEMGFMSQDQVCGIYNQDTVEAVKALQQELGIKATGNPSKNTLKSMFLPE